MKKMHFTKLVKISRDDCRIKLEITTRDFSYYTFVVILLSIVGCYIIFSLIAEAIQETKVYLLETIFIQIFKIQMAKLVIYYEKKMRFTKRRTCKDCVTTGELN